MSMSRHWNMNTCLKCILFGIIVGLVVISFTNIKSKLPENVIGSEFLENFIRKIESRNISIELSKEPEDFRRNQPCEIPPLTDVSEFYKFLRVVSGTCKNQKLFGGMARYNGEKMVCLDEPYKMIKNNCTILSFGGGRDWTFDDAMDHEFGCKIYVFDPTLGMVNHKRSKNINFINLGIGLTKGTRRINKMICKVDRYENILRDLNLLDKVIDYLKIDVEGAELSFFKDVFETNPGLLENVKQIGMEIHPWKPPEDGVIIAASPMEHNWYDIHKLQCLGFKLLSYEPNLLKVAAIKWKNEVESNAYEMLWGRL